LETVGKNQIFLILLFFIKNFILLKKSLKTKITNLIKEKIKL